MSRSARLLSLLQALRGRRRPVAAQVLADQLGVSLRTIYRDVATLIEQGAAIEGEAGLGYVLRPGFFLPPLMFGEDELDALILGLRMVGERGDEELAAGAESALAKIVAVLPPAQGDAPGRSPMRVGPGRGAAPSLAAIRHAIRAERKLRLHYVDKKQAATERVVWPILVGFFDTAEVLAAWCETRRDFRHFRLDRIVAAELLPQSLPRRHRLLLAEWRLSVEAADSF